MITTTDSLPLNCRSHCVMCAELQFVGNGISFVRSDLESIALELLSLQQVMVLHSNYPGTSFLSHCERKEACFVFLLRLIVL